MSHVSVTRRDITISRLFFFEIPLWVVSSTSRRNTLLLIKNNQVLKMKYRTQIYYTEEQKSVMWERWQKGESIRSI